MKVKMLLTFALACTLTAGVCGIGFTAKAAEKSKPETRSYGFVDCDGVKIEYGTYGSKKNPPLLLLPPNGGDMHAFDGNILPEMAKHFNVITVSPRGTGKSDRGSGKLTFDVMSNDLVVLLDKLKVDKTNIFGFSDGGNLGVVFTLAHQDRVISLAIMGSNINTRGTNINDQLGIEIKYRYLCVKACITKDEKVALERDIEGMMVGQPDLKFKDLAAINVPVLNIFGEHDMIKRSHSRRITRSIDGAKELMIVGGGHSTCFSQTDDVINPALLEFYGVK